MHVYVNIKFFVIWFSNTYFKKISKNFNHDINMIKDAEIRYYYNIL